MPTRKKISPAERRYVNHLRRESLRVASVYETRLERSRRKELKRVLALCLNIDDPDRVPDVLVDNLKETYLMDWWQDLYVAAGVPRAQTVARDLKQAKAAAEEGVWASGLRTYATTRAGNNIVSVTGTWKDSLVKLVRGLMQADPELGIEKLTKRIYQGYLATLEKWQCRRIAQTETMIGTAEAGHLAAETLDVKYVKQWCTSGMENVRDSHAAVDGVTVGQDEPFKLPGGLLMFPHDTSMGADASEIINCACDVIRRPESSARRAEGPEPQEEPEVPTEEELREARIQEMMAEQDPDLPEDTRRAIAENSLELDSDLGEKGKPMSVEKADEQSANPDYYSGRSFQINCATCAPAYALRERGFDITAKANLPGTLNRTAAHGGEFSMWKNADGTPASPTRTWTWMQGKGYKRMNAKRYREFFEETCKKKGTYQVTVNWKAADNGGGHATIIKRDKDGKLYYIEPQHYSKKQGARRSLDELCDASAVPWRRLGILRVDDKIFDPKWAKLFNAK